MAAFESWTLTRTTSRVGHLEARSDIESEESEADDRLLARHRRPASNLISRDQRQSHG